MPEISTTTYCLSSLVGGQIRQPAYDNTTAQASAFGCFILGVVMVGLASITRSRTSPQYSFYSLQRLSGTIAYWDCIVRFNTWPFLDQCSEKGRNVIITPIIRGIQTGTLASLIILLAKNLGTDSIEGLASASLCWKIAWIHLIVGAIFPLPQVITASIWDLAYGTD